MPLSPFFIFHNSNNMAGTDSRCNILGVQAVQEGLVDPEDRNIPLVQAVPGALEDPGDHNIPDLRQVLKRCPITRRLIHR